MKHTVEVEEQIAALDLLADQPELVEGGGVIELTLVDLEHAATETIGSKLGTLGAGHKGLADLALQRQT